MTRHLWISESRKSVHGNIQLVSVNKSVPNTLNSKLLEMDKYFIGLKNCVNIPNLVTHIRVQSSRVLLLILVLFLKPPFLIT